MSKNEPIRDTVVIRVTEKGKEEYDELKRRYAPLFRQPAFLEELCRVYRKEVEKR